MYSRHELSWFKQKCIRDMNCLGIGGRESVSGIQTFDQQTLRAVLLQLHVETSGKTTRESRSVLET